MFEFFYNTICENEEVVKKLKNLSKIPGISKYSHKYRPLSCPDEEKCAVYRSSKKHADLY